jgi:capsular polysaccharide export protein
LGEIVSASDSQDVASAPHLVEAQGAARIRRAVLLQGPVGPFFARLQETLDAGGWETARILFNAGDARYHGTGREISYAGAMSAWRMWFAGFLDHFKPDVVLLFGDQRDIHRDAAQACRETGTPVICFEEGYLRPDYVTMELDGNNAESRLRRWTPTTEALDHPEPRRMPNNGFKTTAFQAAQYFTILRLGMLRYPYYRHHRPRGAVLESLLWTRNAARKWHYAKKNLRTIHSVVEALDARYFLVALQVHDDLQLRRHGAGWTLETLIESAIASFARSGHPDHHLVFKGHPLDRGHSSSRDLTRKLARLFDVADRVHYVDDGSLGLLARHCRGMVTVNSTSAMVAFAHGKPVFAAGACFYEALAANGADRSAEALARFWRLTPQLDARLWKAFRAHMAVTTQVNGSYYLQAEMAATCQRCVERLVVLLAQSVREKAAAQDAAPHAQVVSFRPSTA